MRKQFIWLDQAGFYYDAPGNISIGSGSKGSVFFWHHPNVWVQNNITLWKTVGDNGNYLFIGYTGAGRFSFQACSGGVTTSLHWEQFFPTNYNRWHPITATWDFTTPGAGKLRLHVDGQEAPNRVDNATAPLAEATRMYLGPQPGEYSAPLDGYLDNVTVWNDVMTLQQHQALRGEGTDWASRQNMRRRLPIQSDCAGVMTFLATFDGTYDAKIAGGSATAHWLVGADNYNQFARIDDGSSSRGLRYRFLFGMPRHDNSEDDRIPLRAVLPILKAQGANQYTTVVDRAGYSEINVSQLRSQTNQGQGVGWVREAIDPNNVLRPATVRMRVNIPPETNPVKTKMCLGPITYFHGGMHGNNFGTWGSGENFQVVSNASNTASCFKTNLSARTDGYWIGAELNIRTGTCANTRLKVTGYTPATGFVTVAGALPAIPANGDLGLVDFRGRIMPTSTSPNEQQSMEAWLWETYDQDKPWTELEAVYGTYGGTGFIRYERGRTTWADLIDARGDISGTQLMFGRNGSELPASFACNILIESLTVEGPGTYQQMSAENSRLRKGFELGDTFMVRDMATQHSSRVWRWQNCVWTTYAATASTPAQVVADLTKAGTWRQQAYLDSIVRPMDTINEVIAIVRGADAAGVWRAGYVRGVWNAALQRVQWTDDTPPVGKSNPFMAESEMKPWLTSDSTWPKSPGGLQVTQIPDGSWTMLLAGTERNPDHYRLRMLCGSPDRWSFDWNKHWWENNPLVPGIGGVDKIAPEWGGINLIGNRDAEWVISHNPYARDSARRFLGYARLKTILPSGSDIASNRRPMGGWTSPDLKSFFLLPHGNQVTSLAGGELYCLHPYSVSDDVTAMLVEFIGAVLRLWATDDDRHFQAVQYSFLDGTGPRSVFRLGDKRVVYYTANGSQTMGYIGLNRETGYELSSGQTSGYVDTVAISKPAGGWGNLVVNLAAGSGALKVAVLDAQTDQALAGFGSENCDIVPDGVESVVTWKSLGLNELTAGTIRLRFWLSRPQASGASPRLHEWRIGKPEAPQPPLVTSLKVAGKVNPTGIAEAKPRFTWSYNDPRGKAQEAYQVIVASRREKLEANEGDLWDSGIVSGSDTQVVYAGTALNDRTTYFWKVRVRNAEGVWSATW